MLKIMPAEYSQAYVAGDVAGEVDTGDVDTGDVAEEVEGEAFLSLNPPSHPVVTSLQHH